MPKDAKTTRLAASSGWLGLAICLVGGTALQGQTQVGRETPLIPLSGGGLGRGTSTIGEAGELGKTGGSDSVEPNAVKDVEAAYEGMFRTINRGVVRPVKVGEGSGTARVATPVGLHWGAPPLLQWQFRPEDAEIKIGNFYLDFRTLSASLLFSDNATHSDPPKKSGFISMIGWSFAVMFQATEHMRLALGFQMVYLPFKNKIAFIDPMEMYGFSGAPRGLAQLDYDLPIGNWDFHIYDDLGAYTPGYWFGGAFDLFDTDYQAQDQIGRYAYRINDRDVAERTATYEHLFDFFAFRNSVGVHASKVLPTETRFSFGAARYDIWSSGLPNDTPRGGERFYAGLDNERENMRFKPHIHYTATHYDGQDGFSHTIMAGVKGPVTDYINFFGETGYYWSDSSRREVMLWTLGLDHQLSPTTSQRLYYLRSATWPVESVRTALGYFLRHQLGPDLRAELVGEYSEYDRISLNAPDHKEYQAGLRAMYSMSTRMGIRSGAYYRLIDANNRKFDAFTLRNELFLRLTHTVDAMLLHQYQNVALTEGNNGWAENLVILTVRKTF
jgi:hypothetical protein